MAERTQAGVVIRQLVGENKVLDQVRTGCGVMCILGLGCWGLSAPPPELSVTRSCVDIPGKHAPITPSGPTWEGHLG